MKKNEKLKAQEEILVQLFDAIHKAPCDMKGDEKTILDNLEKQCVKEFEQFRGCLESKREITEGLHFNLQLLVKTFSLFVENFHSFGDRDDSPKNMLA